MPQNEHRGKTIQIILITATISLAVGFFFGMGFSSYKMRDKNSLHQDLGQQDQVFPPNNDQFQAMVSALEKEVTENPQKVDAWTQLGNLYFDHGKVRLAIDAYRKSLDIDPTNADVLTDLGVMYRRNNEFQKAIEAFSQANSINPKHEVSLLNKGIVLLYDLSDTSEAFAVWKRLVSLNKNATTSAGQPVADIIQSLKE